mgnify:CR=1 FL=1
MIHSFFIIKYYCNPCTLADLIVLSQEHTIKIMFNRLFNKNHKRHPSRIFYGWWMVVSAMFIMFFTTGVSFFGFSAFFDAIRKDLGWTRAQAAQGPSIQEVYQAIMAPFVGFLVDRFGPRKVVTPTMFISGLGFIILARVTAPSHYFLALILIGTGTGGSSSLTSSPSEIYVRLSKGGRASQGEFP